MPDFKLFDTVSLLEDFESVKAGTCGAIVLDHETDPTVFTVEFDGERLRDVPEKLLQMRIVFDDD